MTRVLLAVLILLGSLPALAGDESESPQGMVLLTVSGMISKTNRGPFDASKDSLLAIQKANFKDAFAFDRDMLLKLPQGEVTATTPELGGPVTFKGPQLRELLGYLGAAKVRITFTAADGYSGWLDPEDIDGSDWILALEANGTPLALGQQGPIWLINSRAGDFHPADDHHGHWVWALFFMKIGDAASGGEGE